MMYQKCGYSHKFAWPVPVRAVDTKEMELSGEHEEKYGERETDRELERQSKLQKLLCQKENCPDRTLSGVAFAWLASTYAVLGKLLKYLNVHFSFSSCLSPLLAFPFSPVYTLNVGVSHSSVFMHHLFSSFRFSDYLWWILPTSFTPALVFLIKIHVLVQTYFNVVTDVVCFCLGIFSCLLKIWDAGMDV